MHVPVPFVDLALLEAEAFMELDNLLFIPDWIVLKLSNQYLILLLILSQPLLLLLRALLSVADHYAGDLEIRAVVWRGASLRRALCCHGHVHGWLVMGAQILPVHAVVLV